MSRIFLCATQPCDIGSSALLSQHLQRADLHQAQTGTNSAPSFPISAEKSPSCPCDLACCSPPASPMPPLSVPSPPLAPAMQTPARQEGKVLLCAGGAVSEGGRCRVFPHHPTWRSYRPGESIPGRRNHRSCGISFLPLRRWKQEGVVVKPSLFCCHCHHRFWHNC